MYLSKPVLNAPEVDTLFSHPLESFLHDRAPFPLPTSSPFFPDTDIKAQQEKMAKATETGTAISRLMRTSSIKDAPDDLTESASLASSTAMRPTVDSRKLPVDYHTSRDMHWGPTVVRFHTFLSGREASGTKPITGLTAAILLEVAQIGYGRSPAGFEGDAPGQASRRERIAYAINRDKVLGDAARAEGEGWDWVREEAKQVGRRLRKTQDEAGNGMILEDRMTRKRSSKL